MIVLFEDMYPIPELLSLSTMNFVKWCYDKKYKFSSGFDNRSRDITLLNTGRLVKLLKIHSPWLKLPSIRKDLVRQLKVKSHATR